MDHQIPQRRQALPLRRVGLALTVLPLAVAVACGDDDGPTGPAGSDPVPTELTALSDSMPTGTVGEPLADAPTVVVRDAGGSGVAGVSVGWTASAGSLSAASVETDGDGRASVEWTLGGTAGEQTATATVEGLDAVEFTAAVGPGGPESVAFGSESYSVEVEGSAELAVTVADAYGNAIDADAAELAWSTDDASIVSVDGDGVVNAGTETGSTEVIAALADPGASASDDLAADTATIVVGAGPAVALVLIGEGESAWTAGDSPVVAIRAVDAHGNTAAHYGDARELTFDGAPVSPDGTEPTAAGEPFGVSTPLVFTAGEASAALELYAAGEYTITVSDGEIETEGGDRLAVRVGPGDPATIETAAGDDQRAMVGVELFTEPEVRLTDTWGNPVEGEAVSFAVTAGGGSVADADADTDADGRASAGTWTLGTVAGEQALEAAMAGGLTTTFTATAEPGPPDAIVLPTAFATFTMIGRTVELDASVVDAYGNDTGEPIDWTTSSMQVASVSSAGSVEALRAGYAEITATAGALADTVPVRVQPSTIEAGFEQTCGVEVGGAAVCWGGDGDGQLGDGATRANRQVPSDVASGDAWKQVSAGQYHSCGLTTDGAAYCWGDDFSGRLGNGSTTGDRPTPSPVADPPGGPVAWTQVSAGVFHSCGITSEGSAYCWGSDDRGQLGNGATVTGDQPAPSPVADPVTGPVVWAQVTADLTHSCGITTQGVAYCWGGDDDGRLGDGPTAEDRLAPARVVDPEGGAVTWAEISAGGLHTCGMTTAGAAYCWGDDDYGQLGDGASTGDQPTPSLVADPPGGPVEWMQVRAGRGHVCAVTADGAGYCWGHDGNEQLGNGAAAGSQSAPTAMADPDEGSVSWTQVGTGLFHSCGITSAGAAYCWGWDSHGQLGNGAAVTGDQPAPWAVESASLFAQLAPPRWIPRLALAAPSPDRHQGM